MTTAFAHATAVELEGRVTEATDGLKRAWSRLGKALYEFRAERAFEPLGFSSFNGWASSDRFSMSAPYASELANVWGRLAVDQGRDPATFSMLDFRGLQQLSRTLAPGDPIPARLPVRDNGVRPAPVAAPSADEEEFASTPGGQAILRSKRRDVPLLKNAILLVTTADGDIRRREALIDLAASALAEVNQLLERKP